MTRNPLLTALESLRDELGLNDAAFSRELGVHKSTWHALQHGDRQIGMEILEATMHSFPELSWAILKMLRTGRANYHDGPSQHSAMSQRRAA